MSNEFTLDSLLQSLEAEDGSAEIEKVASETSAADELKETLEKSASDMGDTNTMATGQEIANSILAMLDGHEKAAENKVIAEIDTMVASDDARDELTPREGKTVTQVAKALQERGVAGGEHKDDVMASEGNEPSNVPAKPSDIDKKAALDELMADGVDFEDAIALVKQASEELESEGDELEKAAAVGILLEEGHSFEDAVELVKQACDQSEDYSDLEKAAAVQELMTEDGMDFADAVELVKEAALAGK